MWDSAIALKCFCATWPFLIPCSPLPNSRSSVCDLTQVSNTTHTTQTQHNTTNTTQQTQHNTTEPLLWLCLCGVPMVMLKPVPVSPNGEKRIVRLLWFLRYSRTHCPWRMWSWKTWKGCMDFGQRRKASTEAGITVHLEHPTILVLSTTAAQGTLRPIFVKVIYLLLNYLLIKI